MFSGSEVKGQGHDQTECYSGRGMHFDGVPSRLISWYGSKASAGVRARGSVETKPVSDRGFTVSEWGWSNRVWERSHTSVRESWALQFEI